MCVCHTCDTPSCVNPFHLFVGTQGQNVRDAVAKGRMPVRRGDAHPNAKLTDRQAADIRERYRRGRGATRWRRGLSQRELAAAYGVSQMVVSRIVRGIGYAGGRES